MNTRSGPAESPQPTAASFRTLDLCLALLLILAGAGLHLLYLLKDCPLDLSGDEAHYWEWSRRLDLSYYSKGPLVAYVIAAGRALLADLSERLLGNETLAVRGPAIALSVLTSLGIFTLAAQTLRSSRLALATVALTFTVPIFAVGALLMTIDAPLTCCYVWALVACVHAMHTKRLWPWIAAGLLIALGILAKYTMVLIFPPVGLALLKVPAYRPLLRRPGPYVAAALGLVGLAPILAWNAQHGWVSFRHVAGQAGVADGPGFNPLGPLAMAAGQAAVIGPVWFIALVWAVVHWFRRMSKGDDALPAPANRRLLLYAAATPWVVFGLFSFITKIQPNWPVLALVPGTVLMTAFLARLVGSPQPRQARMGRTLVGAGALLGGITVVIMHYTAWLMPLFAFLARNQPPWNLTPVAQYDPTARLRGWSELGTAVGEYRAGRAAGDVVPFIVTDDYQVASAIAFYCPGEPAVYCLQAALGDRQSQYDLWRPNPLKDPDAFRGRPCIYVGARRPELFGEGDYEHTALPAAALVETVEHRVRGHVLRIWSVYTCPHYAGLPPALREIAGRY